MSATLISEELYQGIAEGGCDGTAFGHGQTYGGHPLSAAIANAVLDLYTDGGLLTNGERVGQHFEAKLKELEELPCVGEVRIRGMLAAVELVADKKTKAKPDATLRMGQRVLEHAFENGLVFRAFNDDILGFAPSLNYTEADIDVLVDRVRASISHVFS